MIIGVDAGCLGITDERLKLGVYQDAKNLLTQLGKLDRKNRYLLYSFHPIDKDLLKSFGPRMKNSVVKAAKGWLKIWLPLQIAKDEIDIFLALSQAVPQAYPFSPKYKVIGLFHDITFEKFPKLYSYSTPPKQWQQSRQLAKSADKIVAVSEATKGDLEEIYKVSPEKITVAYPGVDSVSPRVRSNNIVRYPSKRPYFLFVGAFKKTKNIPTLLKAYGEYAKGIHNPNDLFVVGSDLWLDDEISHTLERLSKSVRGHIHFLGFVKQNVLERLYKSAVALVSPSIDEGFGLTFLEAMHNGCPVIASNAGSIPEVVGRAGILVGATDVKAVAVVMKSLSKNKEKREKLSELGRKQARKFTWEKFGRAFYSIITGYESGNRERKIPK